MRRVVGTAFVLVIYYLLLPGSSIMAFEPGWRLRSTGLEGGTIVRLAVSPDYATDGRVFAIAETPDDSFVHGSLFQLHAGLWTVVGGELAGKLVTDVAFSPDYAADGSIFVTTRYSGVFWSTNYGASWAQLADPNATLWVVAPSPNFKSDRLLYIGGWRTLIRINVDTSASDSLADDIINNNAIFTIAFSPSYTSSKRIYVGTNSDGVLRSNDNGVSWTNVLESVNDVYAIDLIPGNPETVISGSEAGVHISTDAGDTWSIQNNGFVTHKVKDLVVSPKFASDTTIFAAVAGSGIYRSQNGGASWNKFSHSQLPNHGARTIALSPTYESDSTLFTGLETMQGIYFSNDQGENWSALNSGLFGLRIQDMEIWSNLSDQTVLFVQSTEKGLFRSEDFGGSWDSIVGDGLSDRRIREMTVSPDYGLDRTIFAGIQFKKGVWRSTNGGENWVSFTDGIDFSLSNPILEISPEFRHDGLIFLGDGPKSGQTTLYVSPDRGAQWQSASTGLPAGSTIRDFAFSPDFRRDRLLFVATTAGIYKSTVDLTEAGTIAVDWMKLRDGDHRQIFASPLISPPSKSPSTSSRGANFEFFLYAGSKTNLYRSLDQGQIWEPLNKIASYPYDGTGPISIAISPSFDDDRTIYIGFEADSGSRGGIFISEDAGSSWSPFNSSLPSHNIRVLRISQGLGPKLYAATDASGIWQYNTDLPSPNLRCGDRITSSVLLDANLACSDTAIVVESASNIVVDCAGHTLHRLDDPTQPMPVGIDLIESFNVEIRNCQIEGFYQGIRLNGTTNSVIASNQLRNNQSGIALTAISGQTSGNQIRSNQVSGSQTGIHSAPGSRGNDLLSNAISSSQLADIDISDSDNLISGNRLDGSGSYGIRVSASERVTITANTIVSKSWGMSLTLSKSLISGNVVQKNNTGISLAAGEENRVFNNLFDNTINVVLGSMVGVNQWHTPKSPRTNVLGGAFLGGNYWASPTGDGFSQTCTSDANSDGICDEALELNADNRDPLPLLLFTGAAECESGPIWLVLVYLNGDNNLDTATYELFNRLESVVNPCLQIVVEWDRLGEDNSHRYLVQADNNEFELADYLENVNRWSQGELDMGNPLTLMNFVIWARSRFPARHTMLSIVGHGNGWSPSASATPLSLLHTGISFDDTGGSTYLSTGGLRTAFGVIAQDGAIDLVYFDACLMAMAETMHPLQNFVTYVVASENESFTSYPYDAFLRNIGQTTTPPILAQSIVLEHHASLVGYPRTLAAFDLRQMGQLNQALDELANSLMEQNQIRTAFGPPLLQAFRKTQRFDSNVDLILDERDGYVDLFHLTQNIAVEISDPAVQSAIQSVHAVLKEQANPFILENRAQTGSYLGTRWQLDNANGLSIYFPVDAPDWRVDFYHEGELTFAQDTNWDEFLRAMLVVAGTADGERPEPILPGDRRGPLDIGSLRTNKLRLPLIVR